MGKIRQIIKRKVFNICPLDTAIALYKYKTSDYCNISFAQEGEDMAIWKHLRYKKNGFYIDIGAHHPLRYSNTYRYYLMGWRGINIDAMPGSMNLFNQIRPRDINIEAAISDTVSSLTFYIFNHPELNTFSEDEAEFKNGKNGFEKSKIIEKRKITTHTLEEVLDKYMPNNEAIDFMSIDVEGLDLNVLKSNNWNKYRPNIILAEALRESFNFETLKQSPIYIYLKSQGYTLVGKTYNTLFFQLNHE